MPHFYFHLNDGDARFEDREGVCLPDAEAAWYQAYRNACALRAGGAGAAGELQQRALEVEDEGGQQVWRLKVFELLELAG